MKRATRSHTASPSRGLSSREAVGQGGETVLNVLSAEVGEGAAVIDVEVVTDTVTYCGGVRIEALTSDGELLAKTQIATEEDFKLFQVPTLDFISCVGAERLRIPGLSVGQQVAFKVYEAGTDELIASGPPVPIGVLAEQPAAPGSGGVAEQIESTTSAALNAVLTFGGIYLVLTNWNALTGAVHGLLSTDE